MIETYKNFNKETPVFEQSTEYNAEAAICNALAFAGHTMPLGLFATGCASLGDFLKTEEIENYYKNTAPVLYGDYRAKIPGYYKPSEVIRVLVYGANQWMGKDILTFTKMEVSDILEEVKKGNPIIVAASNGNIHKLVPILGYEEVKAEGDGAASSQLNIPADCQDAFANGFNNAKPFTSSEKWVITIAPAEPVI